MAAGMSLSVTSNVNAAALTKMAAGNDAFGIYAATQWHRLYNKFVPRDQGQLADIVTFKPFSITHNAPYAQYQYHGGDDKRTVVNYSTPLTSHHWDDAAVPTQKSKLEASLEKYLARQVTAE